LIGTYPQRLCAFASVRPKRKGEMKMDKQEIMERIERLQKDIARLQSKKKKGNAFIIREKQDFIKILEERLVNTQ